MVHFDMKIKQPTEINPRMYRYLNPYCTEKCINNLIDGKLQCNCADSDVHNWFWEIQEETCALLSANNREIVFHPVYSSGTAALRGSTSFRKNLHHFWEMKMLSSLYGTDVMIGVGTSDIVLADWRYRFFSLLGFDKKSWGYSYNGLIQHEGKMKCYGSKFGLGSLIGVHLDLCSGTLEYYLNRRPLGVAFRNLKGYDLYPMICSTAAQSAMKMTCAITLESSLQLTCLQLIVKHPKLYSQFKSTPGLSRIYEKKFFWMLPKEPEDIKRKSLKNQRSSKRRKMLLPVKWSNHCSPLKIIHFFDDGNDSDSSCDMIEDSLDNSSTR